MANPVDISDISMDFKRAPSFQNKPVINYYDDCSEDLSMLQEIGGDRTHDKIN